MGQSLLIRGARVIDPSQQLDRVASIHIVDGRIAALGDAAPATAPGVIDADGLIAAPGLIDMHVHLREPGGEEAETIATGTAAAAAGGFTAVACMPNTTPALHTDAEIEFVLQQASNHGACRVYPIGALTKDRAGAELAEMELMKAAGAAAFSDDGCGVASAAVCLRAMHYVKMLDQLFIQHCEEPTLAGGCMNAGPLAMRLGLPGLPGLAEELMIERDISLVRASGVRYHVAHISTRRAVDLVRRAKQEGLPVTTEVCPHHLLLSDEHCATYDTRFKMNPPLRSTDDIAALLEGVADGTIDALVTDHAPHPQSEKEREFQLAPFGVIGLETALPLFVEALVTPGVIDWPRLIELMSTNPARLLGVPGGTLATGAAADITLIDPNAAWSIDVSQSRSLGRNSPFDGRRVRARAARTIVGGQTRYACDLQTAT